MFAFLAILFTGSRPPMDLVEHTAISRTLALRCPCLTAAPWTGTVWSTPPPKVCEAQINFVNLFIDRFVISLYCSNKY